MKRIGIIGGMSWYSSLEYYRVLNELACQKFGQGHSADVVLVNVDIHLMRKHKEDGNEHLIYAILHKAAQDLQAAGAQILILAANGVHRFYQELAQAVQVPVIHICDAVGQALLQLELSKVGLLGVRDTMEGEFYSKRLQSLGIEIITPNETDRQIIYHTIYSQLVNGQFLPETKNQYLRIVDELVKNGAQGVILGCTEIPLLIQQSDTASLLFSTTELHCQAAFLKANED